MLRHSVQRLSASTLRKTSFKSVAAYTTSMQHSAKPVAPEIQQAENRATTWSKTQMPKADAMVGPRFEQIDINTQVRTSIRQNFCSSVDFFFFLPLTFIAQPYGCY